MSIAARTADGGTSAMLSDIASVVFLVFALAGLVNFAGGALFLAYSALGIVMMCRPDLSSLAALNIEPIVILRYMRKAGR